MSKMAFSKEIDEIGCMIDLHTVDGGYTTLFASTWDCLSVCKVLASSRGIRSMRLWMPIGEGNDTKWTWKDEWSRVDG